MRYVVLHTVPGGPDLHSIRSNGCQSIKVKVTALVLPDWSIGGVEPITSGRPAIPRAVAGKEIPGLEVGRGNER